jgi:hypothetical protein
VARRGANAAMDRVVDHGPRVHDEPCQGGKIWAVDHDVDGRENLKAQGSKHKEKDLNERVLIGGRAYL